MFQVPSVRPPAHARLAWIGARQGAVIGTVCGQLYGFVVLTMLVAKGELGTLGIVFYFLASVIVGGLPGLVVGTGLGSLIGARLRHLSPERGGWRAAGCGALVTGSGVLLLHGVVVMLSGPLPLHTPLVSNYWIFLGLPSGIAIILSAANAARLYHQVGMDRS